MPGRGVRISEKRITPSVRYRLQGCRLRRGGRVRYMREERGDERV
jgi:hypothetical protein